MDLVGFVRDTKPISYEIQFTLCVWNFLFFSFFSAKFSCPVAHLTSALPQEAKQHDQIMPDKLDNNLLQALGKEYEDAKRFEGQVHQDISKRWDGRVARMGGAASSTRRSHRRSCHAAGPS